MVIGIGIGIGISLNQARLYQFKSTDGDGLVCKLHSRCVNGGQVETGGRYNTAQVTTVQGMLPCGEWQVASGRWQAGWQVCGGIDASRDGMWGKVMFVGMLWGRLLLRSMWGGCSLHLCTVMQPEYLHVLGLQDTYQNYSGAAATKSYYTAG